MALQKNKIKTEKILQLKETWHQGDGAKGDDWKIVKGWKVEKKQNGNEKDLATADSHQDESKRSHERTMIWCVSENNSSLMLMKRGTSSWRQVNRRNTHLSAIEDYCLKERLFSVGDKAGDHCENIGQDSIKLDVWEVQHTTRQKKGKSGEQGIQRCWSHLWSRRIECETKGRVEASSWKPFFLLRTAASKTKPESPTEQWRSRSKMWEGSSKGRKQFPQLRITTRWRIISFKAKPRRISIDAELF